MINDNFNEKSKKDKENGEVRFPPKKDDHSLMKAKNRDRDSFEKYLELDEAYMSISEIFEEIIKTKKCTLDQADILNTNLAKMLIGLYHFNRKNNHSFYFGKLTQSDCNELNKSLLSFINSGLTFDDICSDVEEGKDVKKQIRDSFSAVFIEAFGKNPRLCFEENYKDFIHLYTLQTSVVFGFIVARDLKKRIRSKRYISSEHLDEIEYDVIKSINSILSLTYPYNGSINKFDINEFYPITRKLSYYARKMEEFKKKDWKEKGDWLYSQLEKVHSTKKIMTLDEKMVFESILYHLSMEITQPQENMDLEKTRELARKTVLDAYFNAIFALYSGDERGYDRNMEIAKRSLLKIIYIIDFEKTENKDKM
ncbi:MAG: hypothetical protein NZ903_00870 [Candidatus Micrarchaeota archaeon]|nr:hypothetical protein [Candidatus Micrarchaeota archaeon]